MYVNLNTIQSAIATTINSTTKLSTLATEADASETINSTDADTVTISSSALELYTNSLATSDEENDSTDSKSTDSDPQESFEKNNN